MLARLQVQTLGPHARGNDGQPARQRFQNLQPRAAADTQRHRHDAALGEVWPHIGHIGMQLDVRHGCDPLRQAPVRVPADDHQVGVGFLGQYLRKDLVKQQVDGVLVRPPVERAQEQDSEGVAPAAYALEIGALDAVVHDIDVGLPEMVADQDSVLRTDRNDAVGLLKRPALEALELPPLLLEKETPSKARGRFVIALPNERIDIVRHEQPCPRHTGGHGRQIGGPFDLPQIHREGGGMRGQRARRGAP